MTDRERLIELLCEAECKGPENQFTCPERRHGQCRSIKRLEMCQINNLADTILSDGWIRPPCKVGEELYCVYSPPHPANPADKGKWYMNKFEVARFHYGVKGLSIEMYRYGTVNENEIGKTVFLTPEEAEKALAERQGSQ